MLDICKAYEPHYVHDRVSQPSILPTHACPISISIPLMLMLMLMLMLTTVSVATEY